MILREWDFDSGPSGGQWVEIEYEDEPIAELVNWLRTTRQWRENPEQVYARYRKFERDLPEAKIGPKQAACTATTKAGKPCKGRPVADGLCMAHFKALQAA